MIFLILVPGGLDITYIGTRKLISICDNKIMSSTSYSKKKNYINIKCKIIRNVIIINYYEYGNISLSVERSNV